MAVKWIVFVPIPFTHTHFLMAKLDKSLGVKEVKKESEVMKKELVG